MTPCIKLIKKDLPEQQPSPLTAATTLLLTSGPANAQDFQWHGAIPQGRAIEIKGVNGDVRAVARSSAGR